MLTLPGASLKKKYMRYFWKNFRTHQYLIILLLVSLSACRLSSLSVIAFSSLGPGFSSLGPAALDPNPSPTHIQVQSKSIKIWS